MNTSEQLLARIAALHPADRQWLLANASVEIRGRLAVALGAAKQLETPDSAGGSRAVVAGAPFSAVLEVLQEEPDWLVAAVLRMHAWPWADAVLRALPAVKRPMPTIGGSGTAPKPALAAAILERLAASLQQWDASVAPQEPGTPRFEELLQRFKGRRREPAG
jgi:hypothetical protein